MESNKRKRTDSEEALLARFPEAGITECRVVLTQMEITPLLARKKPLTEKEIEAMLNESDTEQVISPQSKNRLRKKENGMVFIPRSKYNEHPAKSIVGKRKSRRAINKSIIKVKLSPRPTRNKKPPKKHAKNLSRTKTTPNKSKPKQYKQNNVKKTKIPLKVVTEYHLVFTPPTKKIGRKKKVARKLTSLSDFLTIKTLPSKLWEIERVPPLIPSVEDDSIAKELLALTEENKENFIEGKRKRTPLRSSISTSSQSESKPVIEQETTDEKLVDTNVLENLEFTGHTTNPEEVTNLGSQNICKDESADKIDLEALLSGTDTADQSGNLLKEDAMSSQQSGNLLKEDAMSSQQSGNLLKEDAMSSQQSGNLLKEDAMSSQQLGNLLKEDAMSSQQVLSSEITNEDIEKTIEDIEMNPDELLVGDCSGNLPNMKDADSEVKEKTEAEACKEVKEDICEAVKEETPNAENPENVREQETKQVTKVQSETDPYKVFSNNNGKGSVEETCLALGRSKRKRKEKIVHFDEENLESESDDDTNIIKSLIFRKYSENKKTYEKIVVFRSSMEYTVTINNKRVELIGAPNEMDSIEDLQILLQIVDESSLDSFNVVCKS